MKKLIWMLIIIAMPSFCAAAILNVTSGTTTLTAGSYTYDYVNITGGELKLIGNVTITCNGTGTGYFSLTGGKIYNVYSASSNNTTNGTNGGNGTDGRDYYWDLDGEWNGENGSDAPGYAGSCTASDGSDGFGLTVYASGNITLKALVDLRGSGGDNHTGTAGSGGYGGEGGKGNTGGGDGGRGAHGTDSRGGYGGDAGSAFFETENGTIDCGNTTAHAIIKLNGGDGGNGGTGGNGGDGGDGGTGMCGGRGGSGGAGGNSYGRAGGDAGNLTFRAATILDDNLSKSLSGGAGGDGGTVGTHGQGGAGGISTYDEKFDGGNGSNYADGTSYDGNNGASGDYSTTIIPEPMTMCLLGLGALALRNKKRKP